jgi:hypothetical protein
MGVVRSVTFIITAVNKIYTALKISTILVLSVGLHDQHALQRGFAVGLRKTTECLGGAGQDANKESSRTILSH